MVDPLRVDGDEREDEATAVGLTVAGIYQTVELALLAALTTAVRRALPLGAVTVAALKRLKTETAAILVKAEQRVQRAVEAAGIPFDYQPVIPVPAADKGADDIPADIPAPSPAETASIQVAKQEPLPAAGAPPQLPPPPEPPPAPPAPEPEPLPPSPDLAAATGQMTGPSIRDMIESVSVRVYRSIPDIYQQAVQQAIEDTRGGLPYSTLSLSRIQAAQKALDTLTANGVTGFTDRAGRNWDLLSYVEMATRTAVGNLYDNLTNAAALSGGHDLIWTLTHSSEGSCPLCIPWLGKVLSLTGNTTGAVEITDAAGQLVRVDVAGTLNEARALGFRHPNCRCGWIPFVPGADLAAASFMAVPEAEAAAAYEASQRQRALERKVRRAARRASTAMSPAERRMAEADLQRAQAAADKHFREHGIRMTKVGRKRREHPWDAH